MSQKNCTQCKEEKPLNEFYKQNDKLRCACKICTDKNNGLYRKTKIGLIARNYGSQRNKSKKRGHPMPEYSLSELRDWALSQPIFHSLWQNWQSLGYQKRMVPSFDRLDDYKPYTLDKLQIMTWAENNSKGYSDRRNGVNNKGSKSVVQMNLNGEIIKRYHSLAQASRATGINLGNIGSCCRGKYKTAGGFRWMT